MANNIFGSEYNNFRPGSFGDTVGDVGQDYFGFGNKPYTGTYHPWSTMGNFNELAGAGGGGWLNLLGMEQDMIQDMSYSSSTATSPRGVPDPLMMFINSGGYLGNNPHHYTAPKWLSNQLDQAMWPRLGMRLNQVQDVVGDFQKNNPAMNITNDIVETAGPAAGVASSITPPKKGSGTYGLLGDILGW